MKKLKIAIVTNKLEYSRFTSKIIRCDLIIEHENPISYLKLFRVNFRHAEVFLIGLRSPDVHIIKSLNNRCSRLVVFQHAFNENNKVKTIPYFINNATKFITWSISILVSKLFYFKGVHKTSISCYYFTDYYKDRLKNILKNVGYHKCAEPDPVYFGSEKPISINKKIIEFFYIDEPLTKTLGITPTKEKEIISNLMNEFSVGKLYVKLHPRSSKDKFAGLPNVVLTDSIFSNSKNLIGYKSNLLRHPFKAERFIELSSPELSWNKKEYKASKNTSYLNDVKMKI
ncbi:hypothetical protein OAE64_00020 [bacterium]|nr:hypothetical protein [bacterium]